MDDDIKLYVSVASVRDWKPQFGASISGLFYNLFTNHLGGRLKVLDFKTAMQASCLSGARQIAFNEAKERGFTHWLCLDDDMAFPMDVIEKLLAHDKTIVVANYRKKDLSANHGVCCSHEAIQLDSSNKTGLEEAGFVAFGMALLKVQDLIDIPEPHFEVLWCPETKSYWTEDSVFSHKLREYGHKLWVDHDLSKEIQHIGDYSFQFPKIEVKNADDNN